MAKIQEEYYIIKLSKLIKTTDEDVAQLANQEFPATIEAVVQELVGDTIIVEIEKN